MHNIQVIILAAGKGKRMESDLPKALTVLKGKPFIDYVFESLKSVSLSHEPVVVVGHKHEDLRAHLGENKKYAHQKEQLGTGHAVALAESYIAKDVEAVLILYADHPLLKGETIKTLIETHLRKNPIITMGTAHVEDFEGWREGFQNYSRVLRDATGKIIRTVEFKDASEEERKITEVNPCYFIFNKDWLFENIKTLSKNNVQGEYYLTDLVQMAFKTGASIETVSIVPVEALGANSKEQLAVLGDLLDTQ